MIEFLTQELDYNDVEFIIFNFDGVLYSAPTFEEEYAEYLCELLSVVRYGGEQFKEKARAELLELGVIGKINHECHDIHKFFRMGHFGYSPAKLDRCAMLNPFFPLLSKPKALSQQLLQELSQKYKLVIFTDDCIDTLKQKAKLIGLDLSIFYNAYSPNYKDEHSFDRNQRFHQFYKNNLVPGYAVYSVGRNLEADVWPLAQDKGAGLVVDPNDCALTEMFLRKYFLQK